MDTPSKIHYVTLAWGLYLNLSVLCEYVCVCAGVCASVSVVEASHHNQSIKSLLRQPTNYVIDAIKSACFLVEWKKIDY